MSDGYKVELFYGYEDHEQGIFHAFEAVAPGASVDQFAMQQRLADALDCTAEDIDEGRFNYNSIYINLPDELVAQIKADAVKEYLEKEKVDKPFQNPLMSFIEEEVSFRMREINEVEISDEEREGLIVLLQENTDVLFDYDRIDAFLMENLEKMREEKQMSIEAVLDNAFERSVETGCSDVCKDDLLKG